MTRWATFDCYGTLVDWNGGIGAELRRLWPEADLEPLLDRYHEIEPRVEIEGSLPYREVLRQALVLLAESGQQDHRNRVVTALAQAAAQGKAVGARHHHVEHRDVDPLGAQQSQRLVAVAGDRDLKSVALQVPAHDITDDGVVVGDHHARHNFRG